jgi:MFS family permease
MGLKRFGSIYGLLALATTVGGFLGPVVTGQMFDLSGSYSAAWVLISALLLVGAAAPLACTPLLVPVERAVGV